MPDGKKDATEAATAHGKRLGVQHIITTAAVNNTYKDSWRYKAKDSQPLATLPQLYSWGSKCAAQNPNHITNLTTTLPPQRNLTTSTEPNHGGFTLTPTSPPQRNLTTATPQLTVGGTAVLL